MFSFRKSIQSFTRNVSVTKQFRTSAICHGIEEFFEKKTKPGDVIITGRGWTVPDLRRKVIINLRVTTLFHF